MLKNLHFRIVLCFCLVVTLFFTAITRIFIINNSGYSQVAANNNSYQFNLGRLRGTVYDCNMKPITNNTTKIMAVFTPCETAVAATHIIKNEEERTRVLNSLKKGEPAATEIEEKIDSFGVFCSEVYINTPSDLISPQLIGYLDTDGNGVTGIQKEYNEILKSESYHSVNLAIDGLGNILSGAEITENFNGDILSNGLALTINSDIQALTLAAMENVTSGAAVVSEIGTGKIRAMVSVPQFDALNVADYLNAYNSPLLNKCISAYNVGSVFKPCVAAAILEDGKQKNFSLNCVGQNIIDSHTFHCHKITGHGIVDMKDALAFSCNSYFYNVSLKLGADAIYKMASSLNFGNNYEIAKGIKLNGKLTEINTLRGNYKSLVNLSIGQGQLLLSPVAILSLYEAIALNGIYYQQTVIEGVVAKGAIQEKSTAVPIRVMGNETANILKEYLAAVIEYGTGTKAKPTLTTAAGKTATAETGWQKNGALIKNSWFCGFFPLDNPKYAVSILIEDSKGADDVAAPIFAQIADSITLFENSKK